MTNKICSKCGHEKPLSDFYKQDRGKHGVRSQCKSCDAAVNKAWREANQEHLTQAVREWRRANPNKLAEYDHKSGLKKHGISVEDYDQMLKNQKGVCAVCGGVNSDGKRLSVDHNHECCPGNFSCGECVRGLLCKHCNYGLGHFRDSPALLMSAVIYLGQ
jgi:Recombination endonuclease VII